MACNVLCSAGINSKKIMYESIHSIHRVLQASFSFLALGAGFVVSMALSNRVCHLAENLKNLAYVRFCINKSAMRS